MYAIATHKLNDWRRRGYAEDRARRRMRMERMQISSEDVVEFERLGDELSVLDMLDELPVEHRTAVRARLVYGRSYADIAGRRGVSEDVIRQRVSRGLAGLRRRMGGQ